MNAPTVRIDERWDSDVTWIRINLARPLTAAEMVELKGDIDAWAISSLEQGHLNYCDDEFEHHEGELGIWIQFFADLATDDRAIIDELCRAASIADYAESVWVGSDYGGWPYPPS